ncbi:ABC transporter permease [Chitinophaga sp.]|uniref:ABC transporter permease n=1 Tax=Chitinophaga sp. TaxID=1869181 RepID=UPI0031D6DD6D
MSLQTRTVFRQLWRQRLFTLLNVLGLAISISACWVIYRIVSYEYSFDDQLPQKAHIYRIVTGLIFDEKETYNGGVSAPLYQGIREQVTGVDRVVPVFGQWVNSVEIPGPKPVVIEEFKGVVATDATYFAMVPYTWLAGNAATAFSAPENVVLTESRAKSYFGSLKPEALIGKVLLYNGKDQRTVAGVVKDLDYPTEFTAREFFVLSPKTYKLAEWTNTNGSDKVYLHIANPADTARVLAQISSLAKQKWDENTRQTNLPSIVKRWFKLLPLEDSHFSTYVGEREVRKASKPVMKGLIGLGALLIILACINYINLSTALVPQRSRSIGVRKILGSNSGSLIRQILTETFVIVLLAVGCSFLLTKLAYSFLGDIIPDGMHEHAGGWGILYFLAALLAGITLLSGGYPAWLMSKIKPIGLVQGQSALQFSGGSRIGLRKVLIVFQFVIAQVFIVGALIMGSQLNYTLKKDMGFDKEAVVLVNVPWKLQRDSLYRNRHFVLAEELRKEAGIQGVSVGWEPMSSRYASSMFEYRGAEVEEPTRRQLFKKYVDTAYIRLYNMQLVAGRNLRPADTTNEYVINEAAVRALGFSSPREALGKLIGQLSGQRFPVVGVVKDFHQQDFHTSIDPVALMAEKSDAITLNIKLNGTEPAKWQQILKKAEQKWYGIYPPGSFTYKFYDETLNTMYKQERNQSKLVNLAMIIAIVISCLGLFGLAVLIAFQRTREIGIRKVLGATVAGIAQMLMSDFLKLIFIALIIASPIAWWAMDHWLEDFVYRIRIEWWMFVLSGMVAMIVAMLTVSFQAIRAALANPVKSLRSV